MISKREILESIQELHSEYMRVWPVYVNFSSNLIPYEYFAKEEHYLIAHAANKFYKLVSLNDSKK